MVAHALRPTAAPLVLRVGLAVIVLYHGCVKLLVYQGGVGWDTHLQPAVQVAVAWTEVIAGVLLVIGLLSRLAALALLIIQVGAILLVTGRGGFALSGSLPPGQQLTGLDFTKVGSEYNFAIIVMCLTVMLLGSGYVSLDHLILNRRKAAAPPQPTLQPTP
jgi:putative oxidoreductase